MLRCPGAAAGATARRAGLRQRPFARVSQATGIADSPIAASTSRMTG
jgi:hypothetical protein